MTTQRVVDFDSITDLQAKWPKLVGAQLAMVSRPRSISQHGVLRVGVDTPAWLEELEGMEPQFRRSIQARIGGVLVERIRFQLTEGSPLTLGHSSSFIPRIVA